MLQTRYANNSVPEPPSAAFAKPAGILSVVGATPLVHLKKLSAEWRVEVFGKLESLNPGGSVKDRPALAVLQDGVRKGLVGPNTTIVESSSGNMGIGLAQACKYWNLRFICVVDAKTCVTNIRLLRAYGAEVDVVRETDPATGEYLPKRIQRLQELLSEIDDSFWPNQYASLSNAGAHYRTTIPEIVRALDGGFDYLFCPISTCGTLRGCAEYLRDIGHRARVVAVDAFGSHIFAGQNPRKRLLPGMGAAIRPALCVDGLADRVVYVSDLDCVVGCRKLAREEAILAGASSGGVVAAMETLSLEIPKNSICVGILPDRGERYLDQVYSDDWVKEYFGEVGLLLATGLPAAPQMETLPA
jgi:N-(2-amino-2-carboxyethyl)-L-glutamate synthase